MIITHLSVPVSFTTAGYGNPIILLHGFLETSKIWKPFLEGLAEKRQVVCIDLPGHGKTGNFEAIHSMELMAQVVNAVLEHLNIRKAWFAGHSMGGYVSLAFTRKCPEKIAGIILINSTPQPDSEKRRDMRERSVELVKTRKKVYIKKAIRGLVAPGNLIKYKKEIDELIVDAIQLSKAGIIAGLKGMKIRTDQTDMLKKLTTRKIMVSGKDDALIPLLVAKNSAMLSESEFIIVEGGHLSFLESFPDICNILYIGE